MSRGRVLTIELAGSSLEEGMESALEHARTIAEHALEGGPLVLVPCRGGLLDSRLAVQDLARTLHQQVTSETTGDALPDVPLDVNLAETQAVLGYVIQQAVESEFKVRGIERPVLSVLTRVEVDIGDPGFAAPSTAVGSLLDAQTAQQRQDLDGWQLQQAEDGWCRVVANPAPQGIVELASIRALVDAGTVVVAAAGGGIPVVKDERGLLMGVAAVVDEAKTAKLLADRLGAEVVALG